MIQIKELCRVFFKPLQRASNLSRPSFSFRWIFPGSFGHSDGNRPNIFRIRLQMIVGFHFNYQANFHFKFIMAPINVSILICWFLFPFVVS